MMMGSSSAVGGSSSRRMHKLTALILSILFVMMILWSNGNGGSNDNDIDSIATTMPRQLLSLQQFMDPKSTNLRSEIVGASNGSTNFLGRNKKVAFMFLSTAGIHHDALWEKWFVGSGAKEDVRKLEERASIYVHATDASPLRLSPTLSPFFNQWVIPSVQTQYYDNLFDAMIQLLLYAHSDPGNTHFIFISDNSIPVKTFDQVYTDLVNDQTSRFCLRSNKRAHLVWSRFPSLDLPAEFHRESEMWSSLSRAHVTEVINHLNQDLIVWQRTNSERHMQPGPKAGAPDELFLPTFLQKVIGTKAFNTCHSAVEDTDKEDFMDGKYMGCCPTFVQWPDGPPRHAIKIDGCLKTSGSSPCSYQKISLEDMKTLSDAGFLFLRKVDKNAVLVDQDGNEMPLLDNHALLLSANDSKIIVTKEQNQQVILGDKWSCVYDPTNTADCNAVMAERLPPPINYQLPGENKIVVGRRRWLFFGDSTMNLLYHDSVLGKLLDPNNDNEMGHFCKITDVQCLTRYEEMESRSQYDAFDFKKRKQWVQPDTANLVGPRLRGVHYPFTKDCGSCRSEYHTCRRKEEVQEILGTADFEPTVTDSLVCGMYDRQVYGGYFPQDFAKDVEVQTPEFLYTQENYAAFIDRTWNTQELLQDWDKPICVIRNGMHDVGFLNDESIENFHVKYMNNVQWMLQQYLPVCKHIIWLGNTANRDEPPDQSYQQTMENMKQMDINVKNVIQELPKELQAMMSFIDVQDASLFYPHKDFVHMQSNPWVHDLGSWFASIL